MHDAPPHQQHSLRTALRRRRIGQLEFLRPRGKAARRRLFEVM
jgi:hypothetical protein